MAQRIVIDFDLCEANGVCMAQAPEVFRVDEDDVLHLLVERSEPEMMDRVNAAVRGCPKAALSLVEE